MLSQDTAWEEGWMQAGQWVDCCPSTSHDICWQSVQGSPRSPVCPWKNGSSYDTSDQLGARRRSGISHITRPLRGVCSHPLKISSGQGFTRIGLNFSCLEILSRGEPVSPGSTTACSPLGGDMEVHSPFLSPAALKMYEQGHPAGLLAFESQARPRPSPS